MRISPTWTRTFTASWAGRAQPPDDHMFVRTNESKAAAPARIGARVALRERSALMSGLRSCFVRTQTWQAGRKVRERDGQRAAIAERVVGGRACRRPDTRSHPAAAQPGIVG